MGRARRRRAALPRAKHTLKEIYTVHDQLVDKRDDEQLLTDIRALLEYHSYGLTRAVRSGEKYKALRLKVDSAVAAYNAGVSRTPSPLEVSTIGPSALREALKCTGENETVK